MLLVGDASGAVSTRSAPLGDRKAARLLADRRRPAAPHAVVVVDGVTAAPASADHAGRCGA
jgi:hypothetical protein